VPTDDPAFALDSDKAKAGGALYSHACVSCHGGGAVSGGSAPDLRASAIPLDDAAFRKVVVEGERRLKGMPDFPELSDAETESLRHFIRERARAALEAPPARAL
jgi:quinohemoprotein ethanol dehydrogenase